MFVRTYKRLDKFWLLPADDSRGERSADNKKKDDSREQNLSRNDKPVRTLTQVSDWEARGGTSANFG